MMSPDSGPTWSPTMLLAMLILVELYGIRKGTPFDHYGHLTGFILGAAAGLVLKQQNERKKASLGSDHPQNAENVMRPQPFSPQMSRPLPLSADTEHTGHDETEQKHL